VTQVFRSLPRFLKANVEESLNIILFIYRGSDTCNTNSTLNHEEHNLELHSILLIFRNRDSSVGIATGYGLDEEGGGSSSPCRVKNFLFSTSSTPALGPTQPFIQEVPGALSPGVKRSVREADHSSPINAQVKKIQIYTSIPPYAFMA
jgi:hypothetical protein